MKKKEFEMLLQKVPGFKNPKPELEQYITPAEIASDILLIAYQFGDIEDKKVIDLGCGTGILSIGASIAGAKEVIGIDSDKEAIEQAKKHAKEINEKITYIILDIKDVKDNCDTVIMNPPFGAQKSNLKADRKFIEKAFEISSVIYSLHLSDTIPFLEKMIKSLKGEITYSKDYKFPIKQTYAFHEKKVVNYNITLLRILTKR